MGTTKITVAGILIVATVFLTTFSGLSAQSLAPAPSPDCITNLTNMTDCLSYVQAGSNLKKPDKACCPELAGLVETSPICLCVLLSQAGTFGIQLDVTKAKALPSVCGVPTPPLTTCAAVGIPIGAPTPVGAPTASENPISPGGLPTSAPGTAPSSGSSNGASALVFLVGISTAALATFF